MTKISLERHGTHTSMTTINIFIGIVQYNFITTETVIVSIYLFFETLTLRRYHSVKL